MKYKVTFEMEVPEMDQTFNQKEIEEWVALELGVGSLPSDHPLTKEGLEVDYFSIECEKL